MVGLLASSSVVLALIVLSCLSGRMVLSLLVAKEVGGVSKERILLAAKERAAEFPRRKARSMLVGIRPMLKWEKRKEGRRV